MKILTIGGATQDIYLRYGDGADILNLTKRHQEETYMIFEAGEKIEIDDLINHTGGGATNSAVSFKRLGFDTCCICKICDDPAGEKVQKKLAEEKVNTKYIIGSKEHKTGTSIIINSLHGECTIFVYRGANGFIKKEEIPFDTIKDHELVYITSLSHGSSLLLPHIVEYAKKNKTIVATNPGKSQLAKGAVTLRDSLKNIDILILNSSEAKTLMFSLLRTNAEYKKHVEEDLSEFENETKPRKKEAYLLHTIITHEDLCFNLKAFFKETLKLGPQIAVVTDGKRGIYVATKDEILFHPSIKTKVVDTLGAGDAFGSCFVGVYNKTKNIETALRCGLVNSSSVIGYIGAKPGLLTWEQLQKRSVKLDPKLLKRYPI